VTTRATAADNAILFWNDVALEVNTLDIDAGQNAQAPGPVLGARALGMMHLAMLDAYTASLGPHGGSDRVPTYLPPDQLPQPPANTKLSPAAAASGAAFAVLSSIYSNQSAAINAAALATRAALRRNGDTTFDKLFEPSYEYGQRVGKAVIDLRQDDPTSNITERLDIPGLPSNGGYRPPLYDGGYRPARGSNSATVYAPRYGAATPLFATGRRYSLREPSEFTRGNDVFSDDAEFLSWKGVEEAQLPGIPEDRRRTAEETNTGIFWAYDGPRRLGTPPRLYNQIVRKLAIARGNSELQNASLFALVNAAMADAGILAWQQKYKSFYFRPATGVPTAGFTGFRPLGAPRSNQEDGAPGFTPNFPAYPSGHATFGAAALGMARLFYGIAPGNREADDLFDGLTLVSDELNGRTTDSAGVPRDLEPRQFPEGLWDMIIQNGFSRVFLGVHWSFDAFSVKVQPDGIERTPDFPAPQDGAQIGGVALGLNIAEDIWANSFERSIPGQGAVVVPKLGSRQVVQPYKVQDGDTLLGIADKFKTTLAELLFLNPRTFPNPNLIFTGQNMMVPQVDSLSGAVAAEVTPEATVTVTV